MSPRFTLLSLALTVLTFCGCDSQSQSTTRRIILLTNGNSPYWDACRAGLQAANEELKLGERGLTAVMEVNDGTPRGQIDKLRQYAAQSDIAAVGISVTDAANAAIAEEMAKLQKTGIPVMAIDADIDRAKFRDARYAFIGTDNLAAGRELGVAIKNLRPDGGKYVTFVGRTGSQNAIERVAGIKEGAGDKFQSADNMGDEMDRTRARENVRNAITNHPEVRVLAGIWSYNGPAIADVVDQLGRRQDFTIVTFDAEPASINLMAQGNLDAMVVQNPFDIGYQGAKMMAALATKDQKTIDEMFPKYGQPDGDLYITGLKVVAPDEGSPLQAEMFGQTTEFLKLGDFKKWLDRYKLTGS